MKTITIRNKQQLNKAIKAIKAIQAYLRSVEIEGSAVEARWALQDRAIHEVSRAVEYAWSESVVRRCGELMTAVACGGDIEGAIITLSNEINIEEYDLQLGNWY